MNGKIILIINWLFGSTVLTTFGMWMAELSSGFQFDYWLKIGIGLTAFCLGLFKMYDWIEKKYRRYKRFKNGVKTK